MRSSHHATAQPRMTNLRLQFPPHIQTSLQTKPPQHHQLRRLRIWSASHSFATHSNRSFGLLLDLQHLATCSIATGPTRQWPCALVRPESTIVALQTWTESSSNALQDRSFGKHRKLVGPACAAPLTSTIPNPEQIAVPYSDPITDYNDRAVGVSIKRDVM